MKILLPIRFWIALMSCIILCSGLFLTLEYTSTSKAAENSSIAPYKLLYATPNAVPKSSSSSQEKRVIKGMMITEASSHHDLDRIAKKIKEQYKNQKIDEIILSIHNKNTGRYEEDLPYEPLSKGTISIIYNSQSHSKATVRLNE
ncbi:hypothetical protein [Bacillus sp. TL12]|uniref:hypothetical protein n=1 Tax=Bacillus sp. TL12 TaxID=2894756 RepID=UPI001F518C3D|nr:hypothetical protein [Bacillus sp. TL12]MCI0765679.1 hypothetical protein [Bacillus sp. TL12]